MTASCAGTVYTDLAEIWNYKQRVLRGRIWGDVAQY